LSGLWLSAIARAQAGPEGQTLLHAGNLTYLGAFRLPGPTGGGERDTFGYGGEAMAFDSYRNSLWVTGHDWHDRLAEVTIPAPSRTNPPVAAFKTPWIDMTWRMQVGSDSVNMGGIFPLSNGDLILSAYVYYDAPGSQRESHARLRLDGTISRPVQVGHFGAGFVSGYMIPIPGEWQPLLGGPALTGNSSLSIISRTSLGPAAAVFDPDDVGRVNPVPATQVLGYPLDHPTIGSCESGITFNCGASNDRAGIVWPNGTRSILYVHRVCRDGSVSYNAAYFCPRGRVTQVVAIDANDLVAVKQGAKQPWDVLPYATWDLGAPLATARLTAVTYDPVRKWIFLAQDHGDNTQPLIHVYEVDAAASVTPSPSAPSSPKSQPDPSTGSRRSAAYSGGSERHAGARFGHGEGADERREGEGGEGFEAGPDADGRAGTDGAFPARPLPAAPARSRSAARDRPAPENRRASAGKANPAPIVFCPDVNPYANNDGQIGICVDGEWQLVPGIRTSGVVRRGPLGKSGAVWLIESDGTFYQVADGLDQAYQKDGLEVVVEGYFTSRVPLRWPGAVVIELRQLSVLQP
jgi:hypothetical protein